MLMSVPNDLMDKWFNKYGAWIFNIKKDLTFVPTDMMNFVNIRNEIILSHDENMSISSTDQKLNRQVDNKNMLDITYFIYETFPLVQTSSELTYQIATAIETILIDLDCSVRKIYAQFTETQPTKQSSGYNKIGVNSYFCNNLDKIIQMLYMELETVMKLLYSEVLNIVEIEFELNVLYNVYPQIWYFMNKKTYAGTNYSQFIMASFMDYKKIIDDVCAFNLRAKNVLDNYEKVVNKCEKVKTIVNYYIDLRLYTINFDQISINFTDYDETDHFMWSKDLSSQQTIEINGEPKEYSIPKILSNKVSEYHHCDSVQKYYELYTLYHQI